ncbi:MAG: D-aminoacyl-tRNA deacylase [Spirochaetia bacterium]|nr:D-aminoacyl-tRNA deacylase [Spirochaetia bacterium]
MKALIQRIKESKIVISGGTYSQTNAGLLIFLGIGETDSEIEIDYLIKKILNLRIFEDENNKMNLSVLDIKGDLMIVSQFTLYADTKKGNRPSFISAASPEKAKKMYNLFIEKINKSAHGMAVKSGVFAADMKVHLINDGPVTIFIDTDK